MSRAREIADLGSPAESGLSNRNLVRNGAMEVHQRGGTITATSGGAYSLDRFQIFTNGDGGFDVSQSTTAPAGFKNSLKVDVTSADTSISSGAYKLLYYRMEGIDAVGLNAGTPDAVTVTISFYVRSNVTGNHSFGIRNDNADRAYFALYNISAADTWERKSITIPFVTSGTWPISNAGCMSLIFSFASGSNFVVTSNNAWESANKIQAANAVNLFSSTSNDWYMTGLQMEIGEAATPFEHRSFDDELAKCQRYYQVVGDYRGIYTGSRWTSTQIYATYPLACPLRASPALSTGGGFPVLNKYDAAQSASATALVASAAEAPDAFNTAIVLIWNLTAYTPVANNVYQVSHNGATTFVAVDSEL